MQERLWLVERMLLPAQRLFEEEYFPVGNPEWMCSCRLV